MRKRRQGLEIWMPRLGGRGGGWHTRRCSSARLALSSRVASTTCDAHTSRARHFKSTGCNFHLPLPEVRALCGRVFTRNQRQSKLSSKTQTSGLLRMGTVTSAVNTALRSAHSPPYLDRLPLSFADNPFNFPKLQHAQAVLCGVPVFTRPLIGSPIIPVFTRPLIGSPINFSVA